MPYLFTSLKRHDVSLSNALEEEWNHFESATRYFNAENWASAYLEEINVALRQRMKKK
jgi:hypothetical protein